MSQESKKLKNFRLAFAQLHRSEQKLLFNLMPPEYQSALWKNRMEEVLSTLKNKEQIEFITCINDRICPEIYEDEEKNESFRNFYIGIDSSANELFPNYSQYNSYMTSLGEDPCPKPIFQQAGPPICQCSSGFSGGTWGSGNDCDALIRCVAGARGCIPKPRGCGSFWAWKCDGLCQ